MISTEANEIAEAVRSYFDTMKPTDQNAIRNAVDRAVRKEIAARMKQRKTKEVV